MPKISSNFSNKLIAWYLENKRHLPWRQTKDPYCIWLSEIILQQTRVAQGLPYYNAFINAFPTVQDLANATEQEVLKLWQGLGYYSRARNLHFTAQYISKELEGVFPNNFKDLLQLKGVGDYTASAIASICFDEAAAVVDGNVYRVLSRYFGINTPINSSKGIKEFKQLAQELIDHDQPGTFNQAIMEFGARYCIPSNPNCEQCTFNNVCVAYEKKLVSELPIKKGKVIIKKHYYNYVVFIDSNGNTLMEQRTQKGIWQHLYQFPLVETLKLVNKDQLLENLEFKSIIENWSLCSIHQYNDKPIIHKLSHKHLHTIFWVVEVHELPAIAIPLSEAITYPVPILIGNFISKFPAFKQ